MCDSGCFCSIKRALLVLSLVFRCAGIRCLRAFSNSEGFSTKQPIDGDRLAVGVGAGWNHSLPGGCARTARRATSVTERCSVLPRVGRQGEFVSGAHDAPAA